MLFARIVPLFVFAPGAASIIQLEWYAYAAWQYCYEASNVIEMALLDLGEHVNFSYYPVHNWNLPGTSPKGGYMSGLFCNIL